MRSGFCPLVEGQSHEEVAISLGSISTCHFWTECGKFWELQRTR